MNLETITATNRGFHTGQHERENAQFMQKFSSRVKVNFLNDSNEKHPDSAKELNNVISNLTSQKESTRSIMSNRKQVLSTYSRAGSHRKLIKGASTPANSNYMSGANLLNNDQLEKNSREIEVEEGDEKLLPLRPSTLLNQTPTPDVNGNKIEAFSDQIAEI